MAHRARTEGYEALDNVSDFDDGDDVFAPHGEDKDDEVPFSWFEYTIFCLLGMAMLWAWNMFLAAAPYFASRFEQDEWIAANFESAVLAVSTVTGLVTVLALTHIQSSASYPFRINLALVLNTLIFALLAVSTTTFLDASPRQYLAFLLLMVAAASYASGLVQNGGYAFVAGFGRPEYMQAIVTGQGIAGVLPAIAQVVTVVMYAPPRDEDSGTFVSPYADSSSSPSSTGSRSAFVYFMAAVGMSALTLVAMIPLVRRHNAILEMRLGDQMAESMASLADAERASRKVVSLWHLFKKMRWMSLSIMVIFASTMFFPVFTAKILSVNPDAGILFQPFAFIPLGFFSWNLGDLSGRMLTLLPFSLSQRPFALFVLTLLRVGELPLYLLCNIHGKGAAVPSDFFYLFVVQFLFGLTNGWLFSSTMIASGEWADEGEREVTGGFMGLCLAVGLAVGSLLSFTASGI